MNREVYLGDRGILGIEINSWTSEVRVKIDVISCSRRVIQTVIGMNLKILKRGILFLLISNILNYPQ